MKTEACIRLEFPSEKQSQIIFKALLPETKKPSTSRSSAGIEKKGKLLILKVEAKDTVALRAALNAYLRWINSTISVLQILGKQQLD
jgi:KEOPS complex subunit Pcc1